jgi:hypothetical protein
MNYLTRFPRSQTPFGNAFLSAKRRTILFWFQNSVWKFIQKHSVYRFAEQSMKAFPNGVWERETRNEKEKREIRYIQFQYCS